jgi:hypothetical protein
MSNGGLYRRPMGLGAALVLASMAAGMGGGFPGAANMLQATSGAPQKPKATLGQHTPTTPRRQRFVSGSGAFGWATHRPPGPPRKVAWDKRDARKARNRLRAKGKR